MTEKTPIATGLQPVSSEAAKARWSPPVVIVSDARDSEKVFYQSEYQRISGPS